jgi:DNA polymerase-3 subunit delta'
MAHAFIFAGPEGVGRQTTAGALAKLMLCQSPMADSDLFSTEESSEKRPCGQCEDCRMMESDSHPDYHVVYKELARFHDNPDVRNRVMQNLGIDIIRDFLIEPAGRVPTRGNGKYFILLESELLTNEAQNSLLKILEEPPEGVTIIMICRSAELLLPTILSRCCMLRFKSLPLDFVTARLTDEGVGQKEALYWATFTEGSLGQSLDYAQQGLYTVKRQIVQDLGSLLPAGNAALGKNLDDLTSKQADELVKKMKKNSGVELSRNLARRTSTSAMLRIIAAAISDALSVSIGCNRPLINEDQVPEINSIAARLETERLTTAVSQLSKLEKLLWRNVNPKIVWDNVVLTCASAAPLRA